MKKSIEQEIDDMASKVEKSHSPNEVLFATLAALGSEGIRQRLPLLTSEDKVILKAALEEMSLKKGQKAVEFDKEADSAKVIQGNIMDTIIQEEIGDDDADEKLMKPEAGTIRHQGDASPDGFEGQVIKAKPVPVEEDPRDKADRKKAGVKKPMPKVDDSEREAEKENKKESKESMEKSAFDKLKNKLADKPGISNPAGLAAKIGREKLGEKEYDKRISQGEKKADKKEKKPMKKSSEELLSEILKSDQKAYGMICKMCSKGMYKSKDKIVKKCVELGFEAAKIEDMFKKAMEAQGPKEMDQCGDTKQMTEEPKDMKPAITMGEDNKQAQSSVNDVKPITDEGLMPVPADENKEWKPNSNPSKPYSPDMKKALAWTEENALLKANRDGQNFHFSVNDYLADMQKAEDKRKEEKEKDEKEAKEKKSKEMKKSEPANVNDLIEQGLDVSSSQQGAYSQLQDNDKKQNVKLSKSFNETDIADILGLTEEERKQLLG